MSDHSDVNVIKATHHHKPELCVGKYRMCWSMCVGGVGVGVGVGVCQTVRSFRCECNEDYTPSQAATVCVGK